MKASTARVLRLLRQAGSRGVTTGEFGEARCLRASGRIHELRHEHGCTIEATRLRDNAYRFTLVHAPDDLGVDGAASTVSPDRAVAAVDPEAEPRPVEQQLFDCVDIDIPPISPYSREAA